MQIKKSQLSIFAFVGILVLVMGFAFGAMPGQRTQAAASPLSAGVGTLQNDAVQVGEVVAFDVAVNYADASTWKQVVGHPDATYIKVHFLKMDLQPGDVVTVTDSKGSQIRAYPGSGFTTGDGEGFWALSIFGSTATVELQRGTGDPGLDSPLYEAARAGAVPTNLGVQIDKFTRGFTDSEIILNNAPDPDSTCGGLDRVDVACYEATHPSEFDNSHAVARITTNGGSALCTSWRVTPDNFMMTNEHCITSQAGLNGVEFWFNYQRATCGGTLNTPTIVAGDTFLVDNYTLDFALFTVQDFATIESFGYLQIEPRQAALDEEIYIPQHGSGNPKEFGIESDIDPTGICTVRDAAHNGRGTDTDTGYWCDTIGGSSGSPVLARQDHKVVAIHHYGTGGAACTSTNMNSGVRMDLIYPLIDTFVPDHVALVDKIRLRFRTNGTNSRVRAQVRIFNEDGSPVAGADVEVTWDKPGGGTLTQTATTSPNGVAVFQVQGATGQYTITVDDVTKTEYAFDWLNSMLTRSVNAVP